LTEHPTVGNREHAPGMSPDTSSAQQNEKSFPGSRVLPSAMIVVSAAFAFVILGILDSNHKKNVEIARVVILWSVTVYLLYAHAGDAVRMVRSISGAVGTIAHQSAEKGKSAAKAVKTLNALTEQADQASSTGTVEAEREKKE